MQVGAEKGQQSVELQLVRNHLVQMEIDVQVQLTPGSHVLVILLQHDAKDLPVQVHRV